MPWHVGVRLAHACLQVLAEDHGVDLLHIKGPAVDHSLLQRRGDDDPGGDAPAGSAIPRPSVDADVLVRPGHVERLFAAMTQHGWQMAFDFADGSAFEHASTWSHPVFAHVDVHRQFPGIGIDPSAAFEALWAGRHQTPIAGLPCAVPDVTAQRLILILHAVRGGQLRSSDIDNTWTRATDEQRSQVEALASDLRAQVALAAATGRLADYRDSREHDLWQVLSTGDPSLTRLWLARVRAQPNPVAAIRMGAKLILPNRNRLAQQLGRQPKAGEMARAYRRKAVTLASEVGRMAGAAVSRVARRVRR